MAPPAHSATLDELQNPAPPPETESAAERWIQRQLTRANLLQACLAVSLVLATPAWAVWNNLQSLNTRVDRMEQTAAELRNLVADVRALRESSARQEANVAALAAALQAEREERRSLEPGR